MRKLNIDYFITIDINGFSGKEKASREKAKYLKQQSKNFRLFTIKRKSILINKFLSIVLIEIKYFFVTLLSKKKPDLIFCRSYLGIGPWLISKIYGIKLIHEIHADIYDEAKILYKGNKLKINLFKYLNKLCIYIYKKSTGLIFNNKILENHFNSFYKINNNKTISISNGCDINTFYPMDINETKKKLKLNIDKNYLVFIGRISKWHGVEYAIDMFKNLLLINDNTNLLIVGNSNDRSYLKKIKSQYSNYDEIIFTGGVEQDLALNYINASLAMLVPVNNVRVSPGSPLKLFDSISCGKPIITQKETIGYSDIIEKYKLGLSIDYFDPKVASIKVNNYLIHLDNFNDSERIRSVAKRKFSWEKIINSWIAFSKQKNKI